MAAQYYTLSLRLYEILDWIGASEKTRDTMRENIIVDEILPTLISNFFHDDLLKRYLLGSAAEGTTTPGLHSDEDILFCYNSDIVDTISHSPDNGHSFLMVTDETTKPGYYKLQLVINKLLINHQMMDFDPLDQQLRPDHIGRTCLASFKYNDDNFGVCNGPAMTYSSRVGKKDLDIVNAVGCQYMPSCAKPWLRRAVSCDRFNEAQLKILKASGCFFVGKSHPSSQNGPIEWRLSFSLQERELMASLNPVQHKCYVFLKIIKKDVIHKSAQESISSYHCKTCVFYAIENTPCVFWGRGNFLECIRFCIKLLLHWVKENHCPNFFVPDENMFDRLGYRTLRQVRFVLEDILEHWCVFLWSLKCDNIGEVLYDVLFGLGPNMMRVHRRTISKVPLVMCLNFTSMLKIRTNQCIRLCRSRSADQAVLELQSIESYIINTDCVYDYTVEGTKVAAYFFIPYLHLQIAQCIAGTMLETRDADRISMLFSKFKYYIDNSKDCDVISSYLIYASYCLQSDRHDICQGILLKCVTSLASHIISLCSCMFEPNTNNSETYSRELILMAQRIPNTEFSRTCTTGCVTFLPYQANLVPPALHYEMYRSVYTPARSRDKSVDAWFDWIVVDSKVYLYFLQYVLYSKTNKPVFKKDAIDNLFQVIMRDENLGHLETAYNLLGWIYTQENRIQDALACFLKSWRIRPFNNSAKWHMLILFRTMNTHN